MMKSSSVFSLFSLSILPEQLNLLISLQEPNSAQDCGNRTNDTGNTDIAEHDRTHKYTNNAPDD